MRKYVRDYSYFYETIDTEEFDKLLELNGKEPIILYGAGMQGRKCFSYLLLLGIDVRYFVDSNEFLWNETPFFTRIISPEELKKVYKDETIVVSPYAHGHTIRESLVRSGFPTEKIVMLPYRIQSGKIRLPNLEQHEADDLNYAQTRAVNPPITVLSIIYNTPEHYLRRAIESVLCQTYRDFDYLIIDHGCDDTKTSSVIEEYAKSDARIKVIKTEMNYHNEYQSGNITNELALFEIIKNNIKTEYVYPLDSDDYIEDVCLETSFDLAMKNDADIVSGTTLTVWTNDLMNGNVNYWTRPFYFDCVPPSQHIASDEKTKWLWYAVTCKMKAWWGSLLKKDILLKGFRFCFSGDYDYVPWDFYVCLIYTQSAKKIVFNDKALHAFTEVNKSSKNSSSAKTRKDTSRIKSFGLHGVMRFLPELRNKLNDNLLNADKCTYNIAMIIVPATFNQAETVIACNNDVAVLTSALEDFILFLSDDYIQRLMSSSNWVKEQAIKIIGSFYYKIKVGE